MKTYEVFICSVCHFFSTGRDAYGIVILCNGVTIYEHAEAFETTEYSAMDLIGLMVVLAKDYDYSAVIIYINEAVINKITGSLPKWKRMGYRQVRFGEMWQKIDIYLHKRRHWITFKNSKEATNNTNYMRAEQLANECLLTSTTTGNINEFLDDLKRPHPFSFR